MYKLVLYVMLIVFDMTLLALQADEEMALNGLFEAKHGLNRAVHAAAQEQDERALADGIVSIDPERARAAAEQYLRWNLRLDRNNQPLPGTFLRSGVDVLVFEVVNSDRGFPFIYTNEDYDYAVTLYRPGVIMIIRVNYPRMFHALGPISWEIKGASELVD